MKKISWSVLGGFAIALAMSTVISAQDVPSGDGAPNAASQTDATNQNPGETQNTAKPTLGGACKLAGVASAVNDIAGAEVPGVGLLSSGCNIANSYSNWGSNAAANQAIVEGVGTAMQVVATGLALDSPLAPAAPQVGYMAGEASKAGTEYVLEHPVMVACDENGVCVPAANNPGNTDAWLQSTAGTSGGQSDQPSPSPTPSPQPAPQPLSMSNAQAQDSNNGGTASPQPSPQPSTLQGASDSQSDAAAASAAANSIGGNWNDLGLNVDAMGQHAPIATPPSTSSRNLAASRTLASQSSNLTICGKPVGSPGAYDCECPPGQYYSPHAPSTPAEKENPFLALCR
jgi:hypothetical protein